MIFKVLYEVENCKGNMLYPFDGQFDFLFFQKHFIRSGSPLGFHSFELKMEG